MSIFDILSGRSPLFKGGEKPICGSQKLTGIGLVDILSGAMPFRKPSKRIMTSIEQEFSSFINRGNLFNRQGYKPCPSHDILAAETHIEQVRKPLLSTRYTLSATIVTKVFDTGTEQRKIWVTIVTPGATAYLAHSKLKLAFGVGQADKPGTPITAIVGAVPSPQGIDWTGELWALGDTDGMLMDVEV